MDIKYTIRDEEEYLKSFIMEPESLKWLPPSDEKETEIFVKYWMNFLRYNCAITALEDNEPVGMGSLFLMPYKKISHSATFMVIVPTKHRKKGIGSLLIHYLKHMAKVSFNLDYLEVEIFEGSPITNILPKFGFEEIVRQEKFVKDKGKYRARILLESKL